MQTKLFQCLDIIGLNDVSVNYFSWKGKDEYYETNKKANNSDAGICNVFDNNPHCYTTD